jgi:hypothetical protein
MRKLLLAAAAITSMALSATTANAAALVTNPGSLTPPASALFGNVFNPPGAVPGNFTDTFAFTINGGSSVSANAQVGSILLGGVQNVSFVTTANCASCGLWIDVMDAAHRFTQTSTDPAPEVWALLAPLILTPGDHTIIANGTLTGPSGAYSGTLNIQAVPEPATWAMMLIGFGGIGMALRRRRQPALAQIA